MSRARALDPTSTRVIEDTIAELVGEVTIVIVTHNLQQAQQVSDECAFSSPSRAALAISSSTVPPMPCSASRRTPAPPTTSTAGSGELTGEYQLAGE